MVLSHSIYSGPGPDLPSLYHHMSPVIMSTVLNIIKPKQWDTDILICRSRSRFQQLRHDHQCYWTQDLVLVSHHTHGSTFIMQCCLLPLVWTPTNSLFPALPLIIYSDIIIISILLTLIICNYLWLSDMFYCEPELSWSCDLL